MIDIREKLSNLTKDDVLGVVGLETRKSHSMMEYVWPAVGILAAGVVIGAGLGLLFAPKPGRELRADIGTKATALKDGVARQAAALRAKADGAAHALADRDLAFFESDPAAADRVGGRVT